jgi:hypothetical protein
MIINFVDIFLNMFILKNISHTFYERIFLLINTQSKNMKPPNTAPAWFYLPVLLPTLNRADLYNP